MTTKTKSVFDTLHAVNVNDEKKSKGGMAYVPWTAAVEHLLKNYPGATWQVKEREDGAPFFKTELGVFVKVGVTVDGIERIQVHPVLDGRNKPIDTPNSFDVNRAIQRCLAKAIALHGLGLYVYAGEDLPEMEVVMATDAQLSIFTDLCAATNSEPSTVLNYACSAVLKMPVVPFEQLTEQQANGVISMLQAKYNKQQKDATNANQ